MARVEWMRQRLENWAMWKVRRDGRGSGWPSQSVFFNVVPTAGYRESKIPVDDIEASLTDQAVESLRLDKPHLHRTLHCIYVEDRGVVAAAEICAVSQSTIFARLDAADQALVLWFRARADAQAKAKGSFTT